MTNGEYKTKAWSWNVPAEFAATGGRPRGRELQQLVLAELLAAPADSVVHVDCSAIKLLDFSAADEFITGLIGRVIAAELGTRRFVLTGLGDSARESITAALALRKRQCLDIGSDGRVQVLGPISPAHQETLDFVAERGRVVAADVAARFWKKPNLTAATNRLNTLAEAGLVVRHSERGGPRGSRFAYTAIAISPDPPRKGISTTSRTRGTGTSAENEGGETTK